MKKTQDDDHRDVADGQIHQPGILAHLRGYFVAGLLVVAPVGLTLWIAWKLLTFVDGWITPFIPAAYNPNTYLNMLAPFSNWNIPGVGLIVLIAALIIVGLLTRVFIGRYFVHATERILNQMPVLRTVYGALKQIFETVLAHKSDAFRQTVLLEYPRRGMWALGFVTGTTEGEVQDVTADEVVNVFLPTTPNPTSGFLLFLPRRELIYLDMSVESAAKMIISGGIVVPPDRRPAELRNRPIVAPAAGDTPTIEPDTNPTVPDDRPNLVESND
ncbi:MAG: DUF502 domain-containing protein [Alphaproteobacteria bacterium]|nr:DUF502 domain-containing protein [Alphaproteobacteria bacterium]